MGFIPSPSLERDHLAFSSSLETFVWFCHKPLKRPVEVSCSGMYNRPGCNTAVPSRSACFEAVDNWNQLCLSFVFKTDERQAAHLMRKQEL